MIRHSSHGRFFLVTTLLLVLGCVGPKPDLWPPASDTPPRTIYVSLDTWHAVIALPSGDLPPTPDASRLTAFEEWGYAERAWYLEGRQGVTGVLRALFWPTEGVVEVVPAQELWALRTPDLPADLFEFRLSPDGFERLRTYLQSTIASTEVIETRGASRFYRAGRSYHVFHHCHQYAAHALRQAGLPVSSLASITRTLFAWQLQRVVSGYDKMARHRRVGSKEQHKDTSAPETRPTRPAALDLSK